jgi:hypothetical protein
VLMLGVEVASGVGPGQSGLGHGQGSYTGAETGHSYLL